MSLSSAEGAVDLSGMQTLAGSRIAIEAGRDVVFNEKQTVTASDGDLAVLAGGSIAAEGIAATATGSLTLSAAGGNAFQRRRARAAGGDGEGRFKRKRTQPDRSRQQRSRSRHLLRHKCDA